MSSPESLPRLLAIAGCHNLRDIGGYETADGKKTRWRTVLRSDSLHCLTPTSQSQLLDYGVRTIIDLRFPKQVRSRPNVFCNSTVVTYLNIPLFDQKLESVLIKAGTLQEQAKVLLEKSQSNIKTAIAAIACCDFPVLIHCSAGKDRTGLVVAFLLSIASVPLATIAQDYALSADLIAPRYAANIEKAKKHGYAYMFESKPETIIATLEYLETQYGGVVNYLKAISVTDEEIDRIRMMLVEC